MSTDIATYITPKEYLDRERAAEAKSEWVDGEIREMSGSSRAHNVIAGRILALLWNRLEHQPFEPYSSDMRVRIPNGPYYHPDVSIASLPPTFEEDQLPDTLLNPLVIFEVLSSSTEAIDRGKKLDDYGQIPSLTDYLLVSQDERRVDHCRREGVGLWRVEILTDSAASVRLPEIGCELPLAEIYHRVL